MKIRTLAFAILFLSHQLVTLRREEKIGHEGAKGAYPLLPSARKVSFFKGYGPLATLYNSLEGDFARKWKINRENTWTIAQNCRTFGRSLAEPTN